MTANADLSGILIPLVTPFRGDGSLDEAALRGLVRELRDRGDGLVATSDLGEFVYLSEEERVRVWEVVLEEAEGRNVILGTGAASSKVAMSLTERARDLGASAALVVDPYFYDNTGKERYEHFDRLNSVGIPLIAQNAPRYTGLEQEWWTTEGIGYLDNVQAILVCSGDMAYLAALQDKVRHNANILCGDDEIAAMAFCQGCQGGILATSSLIPEMWREVLNAVGAGDLVAAREVQMRIQKLTRIVNRSCPHQAVKLGMWMTGRDVGWSRLPIMPGDSFKHEDWEELRLQLETLGKVPMRETSIDLGDRVIVTRLPATPQTPREIAGMDMKVGESFSGPSDHEAAHTDLLLGLEEGPVGKAYRGALENDPGRERVREIHDLPRTLLVPTVTPRTTKQRELLYEHAVDGILEAIEDCRRDGFLPPELCERAVMIANVFVHPAAANRRRVRMNNYKAARYAIRKAMEGRPSIGYVMRQKDCVRHPTRYTP